LPDLIPSLIAAALAALLCSVLIWAIKPLLQRYALARPNARSSHRIPTPQGAGIAVIASTLLVAGVMMTMTGLPLPVIVFAATLVIAAVGTVDDIRPIPVLPRLILQGACAAAVLYALGDGRIWDAAPFWLERGLLFLAILWFVNLVNFMDGLDLITVAEVVPVTAGFVVLGALGALSPAAAPTGAALAGACLGFAPFNKPVAKIFLGDVGSLPIGLLLAWGLIEMAFHGALVAALLLPLYYLMDATVTLLRRLRNREKVWVAHRSHFYQQATDNGFTVLGVVGRVFILNGVLMALAIASVLTTSVYGQAGLLVAGVIATTIVMRMFATPQHAVASL
jgi:UDP-N-acetylmuramyl pentapeptide phosphotransferase/UDP-N-acetylglucosamine-1-phosphate transferase